MLLCKRYAPGDLSRIVSQSETGAGQRSRSTSPRSSILHPANIVNSVSEINILRFCYQVSKLSFPDAALQLWDLSKQYLLQHVPSNPASSIIFTFSELYPRIKAVKVLECNGAHRSHTTATCFGTRDTQVHAYAYTREAFCTTTWFIAQPIDDQQWAVLIPSRCAERPVSPS